MKLNSQVYDILKWIVQIVLPAIGGFVGVVGIAFNWPHTEITITVLTAFTAMVGTVLGVSSHNYKKEETD